MREAPPLQDTAPLTAPRPLDVGNDGATGDQLWQGPAATTPGGHQAGSVVGAGNRRHSSRLDGDRMNTPDSAVMCGGVREVRVMTPAG